MALLMAWMPPPEGIAMCQGDTCEAITMGRASMSEVTIIGINLAKRVFQLHGARRDRSAVFRKKLSRGQLLAFVAQQPRCVVAMEACATAHG